MIERYQLPEMAKIFSEENRFSKMLEVEIAVCEANAHFGRIPQKDLETIKEKAKFDVGRIKEIEKTTQHDVVAFITNLEENIGPAARYVHQGLTSSDVLDTALSLQLVEAADIIIKDIDNLEGILIKQAKKYKDTPMLGRTHGVAAEPITLGFKFALWKEEILRNKERMIFAKENIRVGKISGAVGTYAYVEPEVEKYVCEKLNLVPAPLSNQIIQRDRIAHFMTTLGIIAGSLEKFATEIRNLQRTEIREVEEPFTKGQKGSSAMPHKRNPVKCEQICGLSRVIRANVIPSLENINLWGERDISHSSVERIILPDSCILIDYLLVKFSWIIDNLQVYPENMKKNLEFGGGLVFSQAVLTKLIEKGLARQKSYELVQEKAMQAWKEGNFKQLILEDKEIRNYLSEKEINDCFDLSFYLRNIKKILAQKL